MSDSQKNSRYKTPKDYFGEFPDRMMDQVVDIDAFDLEVEAPTLLSIGKEQGFKLPHGYFHHFKVDHQGRAFAKILTIKRWSLAAASVVLLAACLFLMRQDIDQLDTLSLIHI